MRFPRRGRGRGLPCEPRRVVTLREPDAFDRQVVVQVVDCGSREVFAEHTGRQQEIHTERDKTLEAARKQRQIRHQQAG